MNFTPPTAPAHRAAARRLAPRPAAPSAGGDGSAVGTGDANGSSTSFNGILKNYANARGGDAHTPRKPGRRPGLTGSRHDLNDAGSSSASPNESPDGEDKARTGAQKLVSSALILPLLKQLRHDPLRTKLFHSGPGGDAFRQKLDTILADRIVQSDHFPLVDQIHKRITHKAAALENARAKGGKVNLHG